MTKKFISLLISVIMVVGLIPVMSVSAESTVVTHFTEDFETWAEGLEFTGMNRASIYINSAGKWSSNSSLANKRFVTGSMIEKIKIEKVIGYDGEYTNAFKYMLKSDADWGDSNIPGGARLQFMPKVALPQSDATLVYEVKVYIPEDEYDIQKFNFGPIVKYDYQLRDGRKATQITDSEYCTVFRIGWNKLTAVMVPYTRNAIIYLNDECVGYKRYDHDGKINDQYPNGLAINTYKVTDWKDKYIYLDDWNIYSNPDATTAYSLYSGATNIPKTEKVTVNFTEMLLDVPNASPASISKANVKMIPSDGSANEKEIELKSVTLGADKKSIVIDPVEDYENGKEYVVKVSGLKDMYDQTIEEYEFSFTTAGETSLAISAPEFTMVDFDNGTTKNAEKLENGFVNASYKVTNNASSEQKLVMFAVLKDGDTIESIQLKDVTIAAKATVNFNGGFKVEDAQNKKMEVYIWDDMRNMTPLAAKYAIDATSKTVVPN